MSQRRSGYTRHDFDLYQTPSWVTEALLPFLPPRMAIWEPAAGEGKMADVLKAGGHIVHRSDISDGDDFLMYPTTGLHGVNAIVTNPPYSHATEFIERALDLMKPADGMVAMLLRSDFDAAKGRKHLFAECSAFSMRLTLTRRIRWLEGSTGSPSENHAWFLWDHTHGGPATIGYAP